MPLTIRTQSRQKNAEQHERGRKVQRDEKRQEVRRVLVDVPPEELREDHRVTEARHGEELGHALQQAEHRRVEVADRHYATTRERASGLC